MQKCNYDINKDLKLGTNFYYTTNILWDVNISSLTYTQIEKELPGIKEFLDNYSLPPRGDDGGF